MGAITNFDNRIKTLISNAKSTDFDAIVTRDGSSVQLIKYKGAKTVANVPNYFGKEVYFLSIPTKIYEVVATEIITKADLKKLFYNVASIYHKNEKITYDAVIISGENAQYIQYK